VKKTVPLLIALGIAVSAVASPAYAFQLPPEVYIQTTYYSDWTHAQIIGQYREYCDGHTASWGYISMWDYNEYNMCP
jgi:hypothetical protein